MARERFQWVLSFAAILLAGCASASGPSAALPDAPSEEALALTFDSAADLQRWKITGGEWTVHDGAAHGRQVGDTYAYLTYPVWFGSIQSVSIRGSIASKGNRNFRVQIGHVNAIFNWEGADQDHFRDGWGDAHAVKGRGLSAWTPRGKDAGKDHEILFVQDGDLVRILVDDKERWETRARLCGTVTLYPAVGSTIRVSRVEIRGVPVPWIPVDGPGQRAP